MKDKLPLIVGIALPMLLVGYVLGTAYIPSLYAKPQYKFLYTQGSSYDYDILVAGGKVTYSRRYPNDTSYRPLPPEIHVYDPVVNASRTLSIEEAQAYTLDTSTKSPDGYTVAQNDTESSSFFPFYFGSSGGGYYLKGHGLQRKIPGTYSYDFQFLGWIKQWTMSSIRKQF